MSDGGRTGTGHIDVEDPRDCQCVDCQIKVDKMNRANPMPLHRGNYTYTLGDGTTRSISWDELSGTY